MNFYLLYKSLHLISVISWMAGLLYLPRIFVYHSETKQSSQSETFKTMERKLYNYIMMPAMILSWIFGLLLTYIFWNYSFTTSHTQSITEYLTTSERASVEASNIIYYP